MSQFHEKEGILFIISAPSGAGKTTLVNALVKSDPKLTLSVSYTTRPRRPEEIENVAYHFIDEDGFRGMVDSDSFLEHARVFDHLYGTGRQWVADKLANRIDVLLEIDWQGAQQVRQKMHDTVSLFILPPSFQALEDRLRGRGDNAAQVKRRMEEARREMSHYGEYDYLIINEDFEFALQELKAIIRTKRHHYPLQKRFFDEFARQLLEQAGNIQ
jgi:guanylate kinase